MNPIAIYSGSTVLYWSSVIIVFGLLACLMLSLSLQRVNGGSSTAMLLFFPLAIILSVPICRVIHWYCHFEQYNGIWGALTRNARARREEQESIDISYSLLEAVHLQDLWNEKACNLAYGAQRRLEIARALATEPRMLLLDEPAAGMNPQETNELKELVLQIRADRDLSILLIEHDMGMVMSLSDRIYVMEYGSRIAAGTPAEVRSNPRVIQAYLGESEDA